MTNLTSFGYSNIQLKWKLTKTFSSPIHPTTTKALSTSHSNTASTTNAHLYLKMPIPLKLTIRSYTLHYLIRIDLNNLLISHLRTNSIVKSQWSTKWRASSQKDLAIPWASCSAIWISKITSHPLDSQTRTIRVSSRSPWKVSLGKTTKTIRMQLILAKTSRELLIPMKQVKTAGMTQNMSNRTNLNALHFLI